MPPKAEVKEAKHSANPRTSIVNIQDHLSLSAHTIDCEGTLLKSEDNGDIKAIAFKISGNVFRVFDFPHREGIAKGVQVTLNADDFNGGIDDLSIQLVRNGLIVANDKHLVLIHRKQNGPYKVMCETPGHKLLATSQRLTILNETCVFITLDKSRRWERNGVNFYGEPGLQVNLISDNLLALLCDGKILLFTLSPTQNKEIQFKLTKEIPFVSSNFPKTVTYQIKDQHLLICGTTNNARLFSPFSTQVWNMADWSLQKSFDQEAEDAVSSIYLPETNYVLINTSFKQGESLQLFNCMTNQREGESYTYADCIQNIQIFPNEYNGYIRASLLDWSRKVCFRFLHDTKILKELTSDLPSISVSLLRIILDYVLQLEECDDFLLDKPHTSVTKVRHRLTEEAIDKHGILLEEGGVIKAVAFKLSERENSFGIYTYPKHEGYAEGIQVILCDKRFETDDEEKSQWNVQLTQGNGIYFSKGDHVVLLHRARENDPYELMFEGKNFPSLANKRGEDIIIINKTSVIVRGDLAPGNYRHHGVAFHQIFAHTIDFIDTHNLLIAKLGNRLNFYTLSIGTHEITLRKQPKETRLPEDALHVNYQVKGQHLLIYAFSPSQQQVSIQEWDITQDRPWKRENDYTLDFTKMKMELNPFKFIPRTPYAASIDKSDKASASLCLHNLMEDHVKKVEKSEITRLHLFSHGIMQACGNDPAKKVNFRLQEDPLMTLLLRILLDKSSPLTCLLPHLIHEIVDYACNALQLIECDLIKPAVSIKALSMFAPGSREMKENTKNTRSHAP